MCLHGWKWIGEKGSCQEVIHSWPNTIHQSRSACFPNMCGGGSSGMPCMCHVAVYGLLLLDTSFIYGLLWSYTLPHTTTSSYLTRNASFYQPKLQFPFQWCHTLRKLHVKRPIFVWKRKQYQFIIFTALLYKHKGQLLPRCSAYFSFSNGNKKNCTVYTLHILFGQNEWYCQC